MDLTGLPPKPEEVDAFLKDNTPGSYDRLVERLLASPQWGEHRARYWLDAARYADTHGLHIDNYREMWTYRDWVIRAFNRNMPFDQFTTEQLAGDLLPNPTMDQLIATGFHRCNVTTNEGGVIPEEVAAMYAKDRADTTGTVFLGLTVGCATCHDHKFDPISTRDFYSMTAFFRNTKQSPLDGNIPDTPPVMVVPRDEDLPRWGQIGKEENTLRGRLAQAREDSKTEFEKWIEGKDRPKIPASLDPADEILSVETPDQAVWKFKGEEHPLPLAEGLTLGASNLTSRPALYFQGKAFVELTNVDYLEAERPFSIAAWVFLPKGEDNFVVASQADPKSRNRGVSLDINARIPMLRVSSQPGKTTLIRGGIADRLQPGSWTHIAFTYDGSREVSGFSLYINGKPALTEGRGDQKEIKGDFRTFVPLRLGYEGRRGFDGGAIADLRIFTKALTDEEALLVSQWPALDSARNTPSGQLSADERTGFHLYFLLHNYSDYQDLLDKYQDLHDERKTIARRGSVTHVQQERSDQKPFANVLYRGMYDQPRDKVEPNVPSALPPMPASYPRDRLGLARWMADPANPLTARVTVNRFWQELFGTGLVKTAEDFGSQGEPPSHPELLDWLAVEFRESGWDVKKLFRTLVTSAAYRQAAVTTPVKVQQDPENRLLSRGPRFRMDAEMVRDSALAASGLLNPEIGGPSVRPYQPDGVWETVAMPNSNTRFYRRDTGANLYRRSLYTFWKRSAPPASMDIFNAPSRENCTVRRERTNTPLQALVTMNDEQFFEAARGLAQHAMLSAKNDFDRQLDLITATALARPFDVRERAIAKKSYQDFLSYYDSNPSEAKKVIAVGESKADFNLNAVELAAMTMLTNEVFNLDEVLTK